MGLFDLFSFKKETTIVFSKENLNALLETARHAIIEQVKEHYPGSDKKAKVDLTVIAKIEELKEKVKNKYVCFIIERIKDIVPRLTQLVYDFLKEKVENL